MRSLTIFFLLGALIATAQDYLITNRGDTLRGTISFQLLGKVESANIKGAKRETVSAMQTREVLIKDKRYRPIQFNGSVVFMQVISQGYLSLLAFQPPNLMSYDGRLLQKRDGAVLEVPTLGFKKTIAKFLNDAPELAARIQADELARKDLDEIIRQYNAFIEGRSQNTQASLTAIQTSNSKLDQLLQLRKKIEMSAISQKDDALDILQDWESKIRNQQIIKPYLIKAMQQAVANQAELLVAVDELAHQP